MPFWSAERRRRLRPELVVLRLRLFDERAMRFAKLRNARILIYWPHGFGDFVHLGYLLPLLEPSNTYFIARYGDDFSELYRDNPYARALPSGVVATTNAFGSSARDFHLGVPYGRAAGRIENLAFAPTLANAVRAQAIDGVLWTDYPDAHGGLRFPYHTKIRALARKLVVPERLATFDLTQRLTHAVAFDQPDDEAQAVVDAALHRVFGTFTQLCLIQSGGHTNTRKVWEEAEVLAFAQQYCAVDPGRTVVLLNDVAIASSDTAPRIASWAQLFPEAADPHAASGPRLSYARRLRALLRRTALVVGVPAGPTHAALATGTISTIALWRAHHPFAYEEPNERALHLLTKSVFSERSKQWRLAHTVPKNYLGSLIDLPENVIRHTHVLAAATTLDGS